MKKLLVGSMIALVGFATQSFATLNVNPMAASSLATTLRGVTKSEWATNLTQTSFTYNGMTFTRNDAIDNTTPNFTLGGTMGYKLSVEGINGFASNNDTINLWSQTDSSANGQLLSNLSPDNGVMITSNSTDTLNLTFTADAGGSDPASPGTVGLNSVQVKTFYKGPMPGYYLWFLEDKSITASDLDYNDFIVLGKLSAVPEPSAIISLLAVGFLGLTVFRHRRKSKTVEA